MSQKSMVVLLMVLLFRGEESLGQVMLIWRVLFLWLLADIEGGLYGIRVLEDDDDVAKKVIPMAMMITIANMKVKNMTMWLFLNPLLP